MSCDRPVHAALTVVLALAALLLSGCLSLGEPAKITVYSPELAISAKPEWPKVDWSLLVMRPTANEALDSSRIAVRPQPGVLQVYQGAVWADSVPDLVQAALLRGFEDSDRILAVGRAGSGLRGDATLMLDVRRFEAVYATAKSLPTVVIEVQAKLLGTPGVRVLAARTLHVEIAAVDEKLPAVTQAFETATKQLVADLVGWTLASGPNAAGAKP